MSLLADDVRRAYAVFGLRPGAPPTQVRRRYKALARQWHPDRHAREPRNQAEAASRMQEINAAYRRLTDHLARQGPRPSASAATLEGDRGDAASGRPLSREELDRMVRAIGSEGPIDWLLDGLGRVGGAVKVLVVGLFLAVGLSRLALRAWREGPASVFGDPTLFLFVALLALVLLRERMDRAKPPGR
jgi:DnaJ domain